MSDKCDNSGWEPVELDVPDPAPISVMLLSVEQHGIVYGAGKVYVTLLGTEMVCVALRAGDHKKVLPPEDGPYWLMCRGLDPDTAKALVNDAMAREDAE